MDAPCSACLAGPSGFEGHGELMSQSLGDGHLSLKCRRCDARWDRAGNPGGGFAWTRIGDRAAMSPPMGITLPPRSSSFHPFREFPDRNREPQWGAMSGSNRAVSRRTTS